MTNGTRSREVLQRLEMNFDEWVRVKHQINRELKQFRTECFSKHPHYALLITRMGDEVTNNGTYMGKSLPTAATDGKNIYINATWWNTLPKEARFPTFLHEVLHNVLGHSYRRGDRDKKKWNIACDHVINSILKEMGYSIPGWLCDDQFKGMSEERVYAQLFKDEEPEPSDGPGSEGEPSEEDNPGETPTDEPGDQSVEGDEGEPGEEPQDGDPGDECAGEGPPQDGYDDPGQIWDPVTPEGDPLSEEDRQQAIEKLAKDLDEAETVSKTSGRGIEPRGRRAIERLTRPKLDWKTYLNRWIAKRGQVCGRSWGRMDRRSLQRGQYRPGVIREGLDWLVIAVDISSSISWDEYKAFMEHLDKIRENVKVQRITILPFNEIVTQSEISELGPGDPTPKSLAVGGGTCFSPIFNWVRRQNGNPDGVIVFTDLGSTDWGTPPTCSVLWASTDEIYTGYDGWYSNKPPFGETMQIDLS